MLVQGTERSIRGDNWYTSLELSKKLLNEEQLGYVDKQTLDSKGIITDTIQMSNQCQQYAIFRYI